MKRKIRFFYSAIVIFALSLSAAGCPQSVDSRVPENLIYRISLNRERYAVYSPTGTNFTDPDSLEVTVTNTGNQALEELSVVMSGIDKGMFLVDPAFIPSLLPGESTAFTVFFPQGDPAGTVVYTADVLVGNGSAAQKLPITYGVFNLTQAVIDVNPPLLQAGYAGHTSAAVNTGDSEKGDKPWFSGNGNVAVIDEKTGALTVTGGGETIVGFIVSEDPLRVKGRKITVYPPAEALTPEYPLVNGVLVRPSGGTVEPSNLTALQAAAAGGSLVFTKTGGDGVISGFDPATGKLTFSGADQASADLTVALEITETVPEGTRPAYKGSASFSAKIGAAPAAAP
jgi:hypothetical protein